MGYRLPRRNGRLPGAHRRHRNAGRRQRFRWSRCPQCPSRCPQESRSMKVVAIIQARMGSTRLPGKVLMDLGGQPVLAWVARAARKAAGVHEVWIATSMLPADDAIVEFCRKHAINFFRGSETDVLSRFVGCARAAEADIILRLTGDCPFLDPDVIGAVVRLLKDSCADYC